MLHAIYGAIAVASIALLIGRIISTSNGFNMSKLTSLLPSRSARALRTVRGEQRPAVAGGKRRDFFGDRMVTEIVAENHPPARQPVAVRSVNA